jgi:hypothetical protein
MPMDPKLIVQVRCTHSESNKIGTAYPVAQGRIITARHILADVGKQIETNRITLNWHNQGFECKPDSVIWDGGEERDAVVLECQFPSGVTIPGDLLSDEEPGANRDWESLGFAASGGDAPLPLGGAMHPSTDGGRSFQLMEKAPPDQAVEWRGISGAPVFAGDRIIGLINNGLTRFRGRLIAIPIFPLLDLPEFRKAVGLAPAELRVVIASPFDATQWREAAMTAATEAASGVAEKETIETFEIFCQTKNIAPGLSWEALPISIDPRARIADADLLIMVFSHSLGNPDALGSTRGGEREFQAAYESRLLTGRPQIIVYFIDAPFYPSKKEDFERFSDLMISRFSFPEYDRNTFKNRDQLKVRVKHDLRSFFLEFSARTKKPFSNEHFNAKIEDIAPEDHDRLHVNGSHGLYSSFCAANTERPFVRMVVDTTEGHVPDLDLQQTKRQWLDPTSHIIYLIRDPIRPFEIQIGEYRARRYGREPREIPFEGVPNYSELRKLYPLITDREHRWLRIVFAELLSDPEALRFMGNNDEEDVAVKKVIARNPSAPDDLKKAECLFCNPGFRRKRLIDQSGGAFMMANDFPYGPFFHYIVFPKDGVHSWNDIEKRHLYEMNSLTHRFLQRQKNQNQLGGAAGLRIGLNSSVRHLVLGRRTRSSAGASIAHVHKQIWGMAPYSVNLADHLRSICSAYDSHGTDYLKEYCKALQSAGLVIWEDKHVLIYVPFGQIAVHELQIMIRRIGTRTFLDLEPEEIQSLSMAEWIVTRLYSMLDINSFNEILLSLPFDDRTRTFRLIFTFITREVDLAVSELSLLYVVDQHPSHTVREINRVWPSRDPKDLERKCL